MNFAINWGFLHDLQGSQRYIKIHGLLRAPLGTRWMDACSWFKLVQDAVMAGCAGDNPGVPQTEHSESFQTRFTLGGLAEAGPRLVQSGVSLDSNWFKLLQTGSDKKTGSD